jgi:hypothetical protein
VRLVGKGVEGKDLYEIDGVLRDTMTNSDLVFLEDGSDRHAIAPEDRRKRLIAISARAGVWGIIGGLTCIIVGAAVTGVAFGVAGLGFLAGGIGAVSTSVLVAKDLKRASWPLKLAAFVGVPFGVCLIAFATGGILGWPLFPRILVNLAVPAGAILGVVLMILLLAGFLSHAFFPAGTSWED